MAGIERDEHNRAAWDVYGSPGERRAFAAGQESVMSDHEGRLRALEMGQTTIIQNMAAMQKEQHESRAEQKAAYSQISAKLEAMSLASAEARGAAAEQARQNATAAQLASNRRGWLVFIAGLSVPFALWVMTHFIDDRLEPQPTHEAAP